MLENLSQNPHPRKKPNMATFAYKPSAVVGGDRRIGRLVVSLVSRISERLCLKGVRATEQDTGLPFGLHVCTGMSSSTHRC